MNKNVEIKIKGIQTDTDENKSEEISVLYGQHFRKNEVHYLLAEDECEKEKSRYKFNHRYLEVVKNGNVNAKLYFEAGKNYNTVYNTPYGQMCFTFETNQYSLIETVDTVSVYTDYNVYSEGELVSKNSIEIIVKHS